MRHPLRALTLLALLTLAACGTAPAAAPPAATSPPSASRQCAYRMTGYTSNADLTTKLQTALSSGTFPNATAQVNDAGENYSCNDNTSGFGLMTRDLVITLPVTDIADREALGTHLRSILTAAQQFATAPANRYLVTFTANGGQERIEATDTAWKQASSQGLTGAALLDALQRPTR